MTADKDKEDTRTNKNDIRPPTTSVHLPPSVFTEKKDDINKPVDDKRTEATVLQTAGSHSGGGSYSSQNRSKASAISDSTRKRDGDRTTAITATADTQPSVEQIPWNRSAKISDEILPRVVDKSWTSPRADVDQQSTDSRTTSNEETEKQRRLREKEEQLRILQVIFSLFRNTSTSRLVGIWLKFFQCSIRKF